MIREQFRTVLKDFGIGWIEVKEDIKKPNQVDLIIPRFTSKKKKAMLRDFINDYGAQYIEYTITEKFSWKEFFGKFRFQRIVLLMIIPYGFSILSLYKDSFTIPWSLFSFLIWQRPETLTTNWHLSISVFGFNFDQVIKKGKTREFLKMSK